MYIRGGYNVYPIEVENCLGEHPAVAAAAPCVGVAVDDRLGEIGVLFAVPRPGAGSTLGEMRTFVKERLADYKAPDRARASSTSCRSPVDRQGRQAGPAARAPNEEAGTMDSR